MKDLVALIEDLAAAYPNKQITERTVEVYAEYLHDIPIEQLNVAVRDMLLDDDRRFIPTIGELRKAVNDVQDQIEGVPNLEECWDYIMKHVSNSGPRAHDEKLPIGEVCASHLGGWQALGMGKTEDHDYLYARYKGIYKAVVGRMRTDRNRGDECRRIVDAQRDVLPGTDSPPMIEGQGD